MIVWIILLVFMTTFLTAGMALAVAALVLAQRRVDEAGENAATSPEPLETPLLLRQQLSSTIAIWRDLLSRVDFAGVLERRIAEAGLTWSVGRVTLLMLLLGSIFAAVLFALDWAPLITVPVAVAAAFVTPYLVILRLRAKRLRQFEEALPDLLDSLSRALRAGHTFAAGMEMTGHDTPEPLGQEIRKTSDEWRLGLTWQDALDSLARRVPLLETRLFASAVTLQGRFGGKLNEILEQLATTIRDSISLRGDLKAISAQGRMSGMVLTVLPLILAVIMSITSPSHFGILLRHPMGKFLILGVVICLILGHLCIRKIVDIKV